jgi:hypothetical protein
MTGEEFEDWVDDDYQYSEYLKNNPTYTDYEDCED